MVLATVYVGAIGYEDCDPAAGVIACSEQEVADALARMELQMLTDYRNQDCDADCEDICEHVGSFSVWTVGPFVESALSTMRGARSLRGRLYSTDWDDVRNGALYV